MTLAPRAVLVHRRTELDELVERHGTHGQAAFFLGSRGRRIAEAGGPAPARPGRALAAVAAAIPADWRRGRGRARRPAPVPVRAEDIVVVVGQDGLVANVAKYLDGQR